MVAWCRARSSTVACSRVGWRIVGRRCRVVVSSLFFRLSLTPPQYSSHPPTSHLTATSQPSLAVLVVAITTERSLSTSLVLEEMSRAGWQSLGGAIRHAVHSSRSHVHHSASSTSSSTLLSHCNPSFASWTRCLMTSSLLSTPLRSSFSPPLSLIRTFGTSSSRTPTIALNTISDNPQAKRPVRHISPHQSTPSPPSPSPLLTFPPHLSLSPAHPLGPWCW